jgi:hypothetical protein
MKYNAHLHEFIALANDKSTHVIEQMQGANLCTQMWGPDFTHNVEHLPSILN